MFRIFGHYVQDSSHLKGLKWPLGIQEFHCLYFFVRFLDAQVQGSIHEFYRVWEFKNSPGRNFRNSIPFTFWWDFWMLKYKGAFMNSTMSENFKILQAGISWILVKKQGLSLSSNQIRVGGISAYTEPSVILLVIRIFGSWSYCVREIHYHRSIIREWVSVVCARVLWSSCHLDHFFLFATPNYFCLCKLKEL